MRDKVRALAFACVGALLTAGSVVTVAAPAAAQEVTAADCGSKTYRFLFWPDGHGEIKSAALPATPQPHLEVYSGTGKKFLESQNVASADGTTVSTGASCTPAELPGGGSASVKSTTTTTQLVCKFASNPVFVAVPSSTVDLPSLSALVNGKLMVNAALGTPGSGSTLDYNGKACKLAKPPK
jgi:hypothetical protein